MSIYSMLGLLIVDVAFFTLIIYAIYRGLKYIFKMIG